MYNSCRGHLLVLLKVNFPDNTYILLHNILNSGVFSQYFLHHWNQLWFMLQKCPRHLNIFIPRFYSKKYLQKQFIGVYTLGNKKKKDPLHSFMRHKSYVLKLLKFLVKSPLPQSYSLMSEMICSYQCTALLTSTVNQSLVTVPSLSYIIHHTLRHQKTKTNKQGMVLFL